MVKTPIILDCDPGIDDVLAIVLAMAKDNLDIKAITTVCGNVSGEKTSRNAGLLLNALGSDIPLVQGSNIPLVKTHVSAGVHGSDGLGDMSHRLADVPYEHRSAKSAVELMAEILTDSKQPVTIVAVGPLTNVALLLHAFPHLKPKIKQISIMGGGIELGNKTPHAEFNIYVDPEACHIVLNSGVEIVLATLNATLQARLLKSDMDKFSFVSSEMTTFIHDIMWRYASLDSALHDPVAILWVSNPELFETEAVHLQVVTSDDDRRGETYVVPNELPNVRVITKVHRERVIDEIAESFKTFNV